MFCNWRKIGWDEKFEAVKDSLDLKIVTVLNIKYTRFNYGTLVYVNGDVFLTVIVILIMFSYYPLFSDKEQQI